MAITITVTVAVTLTIMICKIYIIIGVTNSMCHKRGDYVIMVLFTIMMYESHKSRARLRQFFDTLQFYSTISMRTNKVYVTIFKISLTQL